jgi:hypothetical protein
MKLISAPFEAAKSAAGYAGGVLGGVGERMGLGTTEAAGQAVGEVVGEGAPAAMGMRGAFRQGRVPIVKKPLTQEQNVLAGLQSEGYKFLPTDVAPGGMRGTMEKIGGSKNVINKLAKDNQQIHDSLGRRTFNLSEDTPLNEATFLDIRERAGRAYDAVRNYDEPIPLDAEYIQKITDLDAPYRQVRGTYPSLDTSREVVRLQQAMLHPENAGRFTRELTASELLDQGVSPAQAAQLRGKRVEIDQPTISAADVVETVKRWRAEAKTRFRSTDPESVNLAHAYLDAAKEQELLLERHLADKAPGSTMLKDFQAARREIAASYDLEAATDIRGHVDAGVLSRRGATRPLSGPLKTVADAYSADKRVMGKPKGGTEVGDLGAAVIAGAVAKGAKETLLLGARPISSSLASSKMMQPKIKPRAEDRPMPLAGAPAVLAPQPNDMGTTWERDAEGNLVGFTKKPSAEEQPQ